MNIEKKLISMNYDKGKVIWPKYVVIHETANPNVGAGAQSHFNYWNTNSSAKSSAHFVVDDKQIIQLGEYENGKCFKMWHVGDNKGHSDIINDNAIGIEICVNSDGNYAKARQNAIELTAHILKKTGLTVSAVKRHYDASGKKCPATMLNKPELWADFINQLSVMLVPVPAPVPITETIADKRVISIKASGKTHSPSGLFADGTNYIPIRALEALGFIVGWDSTDKSITLITPEEKEMLYRITQAEAGGEDAKGRTLVANVIMNRVKSSSFPNSIKEVVFEPQQFEPTRNGAYEKAIVSETTKAAVDEALAGTDYSQGALYFIANKAISPDSFHERKCTKLFVHGGHTFYK